MARVMAMLAGGGELEGVRVLSEAGRDNAIAEPVNSSTRNHEVPYAKPSRNVWPHRQFEADLWLACRYDNHLATTCPAAATA